MKKIFILGTAHIYPVKETLKQKIAEERIQAIAKEVSQCRGHFSLENFLLEPLYITFMFHWVGLAGADYKSLKRIADECHIGFDEEIDANLTQLTKNIHHWTNYIFGTFLLMVFFLSCIGGLLSFMLWLKPLFVGLLAYLWIPATLLILSFGVLLASIATVAVYIWAMLFLKGNRFREGMMVTNAITYMERHHYERIILSCGIGHVKRIGKQLRERGLDVIELNGYQDLPGNLVALILACMMIATSGFETTPPFPLTKSPSCPFWMSGAP